MIIENASGESFFDFMQDYVFDPLEMKKTHAEKIDLMGVEKVKYYYLDSTKLLSLHQKSIIAGNGRRRFISTTEDVAKFYGNIQVMII